MISIAIVFFYQLNCSFIREHGALGRCRSEVIRIEVTNIIRYLCSVSQLLPR